MLLLLLLLLASSLLSAFGADKDYYRVRTGRDYREPKVRRRDPQTISADYEEDLNIAGQSLVQELGAGVYPAYGAVSEFGDERRASLPYQQQGATQWENAPVPQFPYLQQGQPQPLTINANNNQEFRPSFQNPSALQIPQARLVPEGYALISTANPQQILGRNPNYLTAAIKTAQIQRQYGRKVPKRDLITESYQTGQQEMFPFPEQSPFNSQQPNYPPQQQIQGNYPQSSFQPFQQQGQFPPQQPNFPPFQPQGNFQPQQPNFPPQQPNFVPQQPNFVPQQPHFPPQQPNFPPQQPNFPTQQPNFLPQQPNFVPQQPNFPPQGNFPQFPSQQGFASSQDYQGINAVPFPQQPNPGYRPHPRAAPTTPKKKIQIGDFSGETVMEALLQQVQSLHAVSYSRRDCDRCRVVENLLETAYGLPINIFYLDALQNGPELLSFIGDITGSTDVPKIFLCGYYVGGYEEVMDSHRKGGLEQYISKCYKKEAKKDKKKNQ